MLEEEINFDVQKKRGTSFILLDAINSGVLRFFFKFSVMTVAESKAQTIKFMNDCLNCIIR